MVPGEGSQSLAAADPDGHRAHGIARGCVLAVGPLLSSSQTSFKVGVVIDVNERPLLAESGPSKSSKFTYLNVRFWEKRTFRNIPKIFTKLTNLERPLSAQKRTFG